MRVLEIERFDELRQAAARLRAQPAQERGGAGEALRVGVIGDDVDGAVPGDAVVGNCPVEGDGAGPQHGEAQALGLLGRG